MPEPRPQRAGTQDPKKQASLAVEQLGFALNELIDQGNLSGVEKVVADLSSTIGLEETAVAPLLHRAREEAGRRPVGFDPELRAAAQKEGCAFESKHPYLLFGCITLHEKKPGEWTLSILDGVQVETIRSRRANVVAEHCIAQIVRIEDVLGRANALTEDILTAWDVLRGSAPGHDSISANLLMVLASHGRGLKNVLVSADAGERRSPLSRAQFGYLLARISRGADNGLPSGIKIRFSGADQARTKNPANYIAIPENDDPRRTTGRRLVSTITISTE